MVSRRRLLQVLAVPSLQKQGIRSRVVRDVNGAALHVLEAGYDRGARRPAVMLLHGFPELAYSWRKVLPALAAAGFHAIAPDLRGYGRSSGAGVGFDDDLRPFRTFNEVKDVVSLVSALGYEKAAVVGHDFGSPLAAWCAVMHPEIFTRVVLMSAPYGGAGGGDRVYEELGTLQPPRKHYQKYFATREANENMWHAKQGLRAFLRAYYHMKSADWKQNKPFALGSWSAAELAKLPRYYVMDRDLGMAETVATEMPSAGEIARCQWLTEYELGVYASEYGRTGFQGGLNRYRVRWVPELNAEMRKFAGRTIDIPAMFIAGASDWGIHQRPGALEAMEKTACTKFRGMHLVAGAGHWVQQEQPDAVNRLLVSFLRD
ncbi:MAG: alpha/beta fold hydrolase [Bryobacteraceae bacterium]